MMRQAGYALATSYAAARGDENIDYMVTRGRLERRRRRTARAGVDGHGGQPAADLLPGMRCPVQIASQRLLAKRSGIYPLKERRSRLMPASGAGGVETSCDAAQRIFTERVPESCGCAVRAPDRLRLAGIVRLLGHSRWRTALQERLMKTARDAPVSDTTILAGLKEARQGSVRKQRLGRRPCGWRR